MLSHAPKPSHAGQTSVPVHPGSKALLSSPSQAAACCDQSVPASLTEGSFSSEFCLDVSTMGF